MLRTALRCAGAGTQIRTYGTLHSIPLLIQASGVDRVGLVKEVCVRGARGYTHQARRDAFGNLLTTLSKNHISHKCLRSLQFPEAGPRKFAVVGAQRRSGL